MTTRVRWSRRANLELLAATAYEAARIDPEAGDTLRFRILASAARLAVFPKLGPSSLRGTRKLVVTETDYVLIYREMPDHIRIAALWHHALRKRR